MTVSFTVFGMVIGYAVFIYIAISSTNIYIKLAYNSILQYVYSVSREYNTDNQGELLKIIDQRMTNVVNLAKAFEGIFPQLKFDLYFNDGISWQHTYMDEKGVVKSEKITDKLFSQSLEKVRTERILTSSRLFFGAEDKVNVKINVSPSESNYAQIISFNIYRMGFFNFLKKNFFKALIFFILLFLISRILGQIFGSLLARPLENLSQEAEAIASGQYERRFTTGRKDEIGRLAEHLNTMASRIIDGTKEREDIFIGILIALTRAIDAKSPWTAGHSERVTKFSEAIGRGLHLNDDEMRILSISAILHDVGKIAVPEKILNKPEKLSDKELDVGKRHPMAGADIISSIPSYETIVPGILYHHERWDGTGYPTGIKGKDIPLFARIICIADVYDALTEDRPYSKAWNKKRVKHFFETQKGKIFDPELVDVFMKVHEF
ncbi:MAG: HD domain-containing protein [Syntrophaceae bacterium]|nr:HD domain-containing protein [Syntrophaceae bacterium]